MTKRDAEIGLDLANDAARNLRYLALSDTVTRSEDEGDYLSGWKGFACGGLFVLVSVAVGIGGAWLLRGWGR